ncbi:probable methyltransferase At1g27930 [Andrographis paniculata]|uniref:probable methyltransferase At1g27930 n=1 Tax=Andrographis paniculata TaxID=175694 RepID=UPI0021E8084D|nr:probable methyltransferase At1g27930 [Andrographis paniculata]
MQKIHTQKHYHHNRRQLKPESTRLLGVAVAGLISGALLISLYLRAPLFCGGAPADPRAEENGTAAAAQSAAQVEAIVHYATSRIVPQQSHAEIGVSVGVLNSLGGSANLLVFGLGHDSLMWAAINPRGKTLFLEEDPKWVQTVLKHAPGLRADTVRYRTRLSEADELLRRHYGGEPDCAAAKSFLRGNDKCRLALNMLPEEVYATEWDMIMVDAPRGYFPEAPGRMAAIYSAAVMGRNRRRSGATHVFVHDVDRRVERMYAEAFLCKKNLVTAVGRLWHFQIPAAADLGGGFC